MKRSIIFITFSLTFLLLDCAQAQQANQFDSIKSKEYNNSIYHFSVDIPDDWKLYGQIINDTINHKAIADWGLPLIYSDLEKTEIENSISITAYHRTDINSVDKLILAEYLRHDPTKNAMEVDSTTKNARIIYSSVDGNEYKGKSYFVFNNNIGYVINFMATPGTYDKNINIFEAFYKRIKFL